MPADFQNTRWSLVLACAAENRAVAERALAELCQIYWYPLYAFLRRRGHPAEEAADLLQSFFAALIEHRDLERVDRTSGRFRSFLIASLRNFAANQWDRERALKRGGGHPAVSLDALDAERRYDLEPVDPETPDTVYERKWAIALLERGLERLRVELDSEGDGALFAALKPFLVESGGPYAEVSAALELEEGALRVRVHRLRRRFGKLLREEIAQTVAAPEEIEGEVRHLLTALSRRAAAGS